MGWAGTASELLNNYFINESDTLYSLSATNDNKSSLVQKMEALGSNLRTLAPITLYELAARSIPNITESERLLRLIRNYGTTLSKIHIPSLIPPLINLTIMFSFLRRALTKSTFFHNTLSAFMALRKLHFIQYIRSTETRGQILYKFVSNTLNGQPPLDACEKAFGSLDLSDNLFYFHKKPSFKTKSSRNKSNSNKSNNDNKDFQRTKGKKCN